MPTVYRFTGQVYQRGNNYFVDVPETVSLGGGSVALVGTANGVSFRSSAVPAGGGRYRLILNQETRAALGVDTGDSVTFALQEDTTSREPPLPDDLRLALEAVAGALRKWDGYPTSHRREVLTWINEARKPETHARRIARAVSHIMG